VAAPRFKIGDLVKACYTFYEYYTFPYYDDDDGLFYPWSGVVISVSYDLEYFGDEPIYEIICTDSVIRYFSEWELRLINKS
jgi:hypothetical protein